MAEKKVDIGLLTVIPVELQAALNAFGVKLDDAPPKPESGPTFVFGEIFSEATKRPYTFALGTTGAAGNAKSAVRAGQLYATHQPSMMILMGIAAGNREKTRIGQVFVSDRVLGYESGAMIEKDGKSVFAPRPEIIPVAPSLDDDLSWYFALKPQARLLELFGTAGGSFPSPVVPEDEGYICKDFEIETGPIGSGEKLLKDGEFLYQTIRGLHERTYVGEMEGHGFATAAYNHECPWLVIRGVSDFGDPKKRSKYHPAAALAAAVAALDFVRHGLRLKASAAVASPPQSAATSRPRHDALLQYVRTELKPPVSAPSFDLTLSFARTYDDLSAARYDPERTNIDPVDLLTGTSKFVLINAPGGFGKTSAVADAITAAPTIGFEPFLLHIRSRATKPEEWNAITTEQAFVYFSIGGTYEEFIEAAKSGRPVVVFIDGLDTAYGGAGTTMLRQFEDLCQRYANTKVIVTDRMSPHPSIVKYARATVDRLPEETVRGLVAREFGGIQTPTQTDLSLLQIPFFLNLQFDVWQKDRAEGITPSAILPRKELFDAYLTKVVDLEPPVVARLARSAFKAYEAFNGPVFQQDWWTGEMALIERELNVKFSLADRLRASGAVQVVEPTGLRFFHQLLHDYLAGSRVAEMSPERWTEKVFDVVTFKGGSSDSLSFAAECLPVGDVDSFFISIYDWNYSLVFDTVHDLERILGSRRVSSEVLFAMNAVLAEKRFDYFDYTASRAVLRLQESKWERTREFLEATSESKLMDLVRHEKLTTPRYEDWQRLFTSAPADLRLSDLPKLKADPLTGWTLSNVLRRGSVGPAFYGEISAYYRAQIADRPSHDRPSQRWRFVHVLGKCVTRENAEFLADVVLNDDNYWVRYGALRSLLEVISLMSSDERPSAFELLLEVVRKISDRDLITQMLFKHVVIPTADTGWYDAIADIVRKAGERLSSADGDLVKNVLANAGEARESLKARESTQ